MPQLHLSSYISTLSNAIKSHDASTLAPLLSLYPINRNPSLTKNWHGFLLLDFMDKPERGVQRQDRILGHPNYVPSYKSQFERTFKKEWSEIVTNHVWALVALYPPMNPLTGQYVTNRDAVVSYQKQHELVNALYRFMINSKDHSSSSQGSGWCLEILYRVCQDLRRVAQEADQQLASSGMKVGKLEECSRLLQKCFSICLNDRSGEWFSSRKMGTYYLATLLFKTYFKLNSTTLCKNIIRGITASHDLPPLSNYPAAHRVTYTYYMGVFAFLREDYGEAEKRFKEALEGIHKKATRNIDLILDYLIPILLLRGIHPSQKLLSRPSTLHKQLYGPFISAIKTGNVRLYDRQLELVEKRLMERGTYLVVERAREGCVRGLLKKTWILEGKPSRISIETFRKYYNAAMKVSPSTTTSVGGEGGAGVIRGNNNGSDEDEYDSEEMECLLANCINRGLIKGYISHAHQMVVLSKEKPFPWYPPFRTLSPQDLKDREERELMERKRQIPLPTIQPPPPPSVPSTTSATTTPAVSTSNVTNGGEVGV